jgi:CRP-like cAMP-binding protein
MCLFSFCAYDRSHMKSVVLPPSLKTLLPPEIHELCTGAFYKKNERLFLTGKIPQSMFYVVAGEVTLERTGLQGEPVVLQRTRLGFVSEASLKVAKYHCDALAITDSNVIKVPAKELAAALDRDPEFASRWISMLNAEVKRLRLHCERLSMKSLKDRVLHLINTEGKDGKYLVNTGLKSLAGELGVTHEALYRTLAALEKTKTIRREEGLLALTSKS